MCIELYQNNFFHSDYKPENFVIDQIDNKQQLNKYFTIKLIDFGFSTRNFK